jgi:hypothetical protein
MSKRHELKSWPEFFKPIMSGEKTFELRKNDRRFKVGDVLRLREWEPTTAKYSGRECIRVVTYILEGVGPGGITPYHGLAREYAILGLREG